MITHHVPSASDHEGRGTQSGDYWTLTTRDGTTYYFGLNQLPGWSSGDPQTNSVDSVPVFSAHSGDPCYKADFSASVCTMAYRWNLDYVTDVHGNAMAYYYTQDTNAYAQDGNTSSAASYVRDSHLAHIDYGFTDGNAYTGHAPDQVEFDTADRCVSGTCDPLNSANAPNWPDVPYANQCTAGESCQTTWPTFWSTVRLASITTQQWNGTAWAQADSWKLSQSFPKPGDGTQPTLWLDSITHTGADTTANGSAVTLPKVTFSAQTGGDLENRVNPASGVALDRYRITRIVTETGAVISVNYEVTKSCMTTVNNGYLPSDPSKNDRSCFPVYWQQYTPSTGPDWFNKWAVQSVAVADPSGGSGGLYTSYGYSGAAWHYDDNELVMPKYRTYGQWRGYQDVQTYTGTGSDAQTESETTYYQGMDGDTLPGGGTRSVTLADSQNGQHVDYGQLAGNPLETTAYDFASGPVDHSTIYSYWVSSPVVSRERSGLPDLTANATGVVEEWARQAITDGGTSSWRKTETDTSYDATPSDHTFGLPLYVFSHGDLSDPSQQTCMSTTYAPVNTSKNLAGLPAEVETDAAPCGGSSPNGASAPGAGQVNALTAPTSLSRPADVISDTRTFYDNPTMAQTWPQPASPAWPQATPQYGDVSVVQQATGYANGAFTYQTKHTAVYDTYGRPVDSYDANGNLTTTSYTMTSGVTTQETVTNPLGQATTTVLDPLRGLPVSVTDPNGIVTALYYDGLGQLTDVWGGGRTPASDPKTPNEMYTYQPPTSATQPTVVTAQRLNDESGYITSTTLYDALLRVRQTQYPTPQGGSLVSDNFYDTRGWLSKTNTNWFSSASPGSSILTIGDSKVHDQTVTAFDGLGRPVLSQSLDDSTAVTGAAYAYYGDRVTTAQFDPSKCQASGGTSSCPAGGTPTSTVTDALGRTTERDSYTTPPAVSITNNSNNTITTVGITGGTTQATTYSYNHRGWLSDITDAASGEDWSRKYDLLGRVTSTTDPNSGTTQMSYDPNGNLTQVTDANNNPITYTYDALNRKTGEYDGPTTAAPLMASFVYDNANNAVANMQNPIGHLTTETSYSGGYAYTIQQQGFTNYGESAGEQDTIPAAPGLGALAGSYTLTHTYTATTGLPHQDIYPASPGGGALPAETVGHGYGVQDLPTTLGSNLAGYEQDVTYNDLFQVAQQQLGSISDRAYVTSTYDLHTGSLTDTQVANPTAAPGITYDDTHYNYNPFQQITKQTDTRTLNSGATQAETQCFGYDTLGRLTQAWTGTDNCAADPAGNGGATVGDQIPGGAYWTTWKFDPLGDQTTQNQHSLTGGANTVTTYTYNGNGNGQPNTLTSTSTTGPSGTSTAAYTFDADGNTRTRTLPSGNQTLTWTDDGKLATDTTSAGKTSYVYDAGGNLLLQKDPGQTTLYLFGGAEQIYLSTAGATNGTITGTRFLPLPGGGLVARTGAGTNYAFELTDQHGTSLLTLDNTAANPAWRQFTPYGAPRGQAPATWPDPNAFLGKPTDATTGLTIIGARQYDPGTGRFLSIDPVLDPATPQSLNGYTYAGDNPATNADPTGLYFCNGAGYCGGGWNSRHHTISPGPAPGPGAYTSTGGAYTWPPGASVLPPQARPVYAHFMDTWQPSYGDVGIRGLLSSLDTFCGNNINLCGGKLTATIWGTYLAAAGIGAIGPASQRLVGRLLTAEDGVNLYRGMRGAADGSPELGPSASKLGARPGVDIPVDENGMVRPGTGGMSVNESPTGMPEFRRPPSFGGSGKNLNMYCISSCDLGPGLQYAPEAGGHGFLEPAWGMSFDEYQAYLYETQVLWGEVSP